MGYKKSSTELGSYRENDPVDEIPYKSIVCSVLSYNGVTRVLGVVIEEMTVQTVLNYDLPPNTSFITVKYRKNNDGKYEFIF